MLKKKILLLKFLGLFGAAVFITALLLLVILADMAKSLPSPEQFISRHINQSTKIYDKTGEVLLYEIHGNEKRTLVPLEEIPNYAQKATLAIEDQSFYEHPAFDWRATIRAIIVDIIKGKAVQGGSTITQQLAKNAFLTSEKTITRKVKELILAYWIEQKYTKDEILNLYLNQIPYGSNAYGIESASQLYFNKSAKNLTLEESAVLAAMIQAPSYYSPWSTHYKELMQRKNYVLEQMLDLGFIDKEEKQRAMSTELKFAEANIGVIKAPHFVMMVKEYLSDKYGEEIVEMGGLKVITTLDWNIQQAGEKAIKEGANRNSNLYNGRNAAMVVEDPKTGQILALVGSKDYFSNSEPAGCSEGSGCLFEGKFNAAVQGKRQPGSSFKPFAYLTAFKKGYTPETLVFDLPTEFSTNDACPKTNINYLNENPLCFHPENFDHIFRGPINLRGALAQSINVPAVKVLYLAGLLDTIQTAQDFGITTLTDPNRYGLSLVLGGGEVTLLDMVGAYSVFSQDGTKHQQSIILEIKDSNGEVLEKYSDNATSVAEPQYARLINDILSDVEARSLLFENSLSLTVFGDRQMAMKTGTTNNYRDAWTIGYTPSLVAGIWAGNNNQQPMQKSGSSILAALPIWSAFMNEVLPNQPIETFNAPEPTSINKEMLNGQYTTTYGMHNILYYVDKNNPLGEKPINPESDSQYWNLEWPVLNWIQREMKTINN